MKYVNVIIENNTRHTDTFYTYLGDDDIKTGDVVYVPFNKGNSEKRGYVLGEVEKPGFDESKIKKILSVDKDISLNQEMIETSIWMKRRYGIKYLDGVRCFIPPGKATKEGKEKRPLQNVDEDRVEIERLTDEQRSALDEILPAIDERIQKNFLIHGVTGSGKTEIYMQAIQRVLDYGRTAIMLVPEIALTKQITERFVGRFGREKVAILHSKLTPRERFDEWIRIRSGEAKIVIGARMAVFAPLENIGLIIMDEEHEQTYKSDQNPKYDTVDIALKRTMYYDGVLILGSATPSVVSYERSIEGIFQRIELKQRYNNTELPDIDVVDMREELKSGNSGMLSGKLYEEMKRALASKDQIILFLNRRGYSGFVSCRECGYVTTCDSCGISMTYHKDRNAMVCHYCGRTAPYPRVCPECGSTKIRQFGVGTEQVEEYVKELFPEAEVDRFDLDTAKDSRRINSILNKFSKGKTDILIGTQLVAKGLDFRNVGLVGVIAADIGLNIPDYRSSERTFQLITQVAGRAGRGDKKGRVIVQTYSPENIAILSAAQYDYENYFRKEIEFRRLMGYPPFTDLILVEFTDRSEDKAEAAADRFYDSITNAKELNVNDPVFVPKVSSSFKGRNGNAFRYYVLIKSSKGNRKTYLDYITKYIRSMVRNRSTTSVGVDINPYSSF